MLSFSPETAVNRQQSTGKTSHDEIAPSQQMEAAAVPDVARCRITYLMGEKDALPVPVSSVVVRNIRAQGTQCDHAS